MTVVRETLMAFVDGELSPDEERRVAAEMAKDPALGAYVEQQQALAAKLRSAFAPVLEEPIPARIEQAVRETDIPSDTPASSPLAARLQRLWREQARLIGNLWLPAGVMAAGVALGVVLAGSFGTGTEMQTKGGALIAQGELARVLTLELASEQSGDTRSATRLGVSFRSGDGAFCRSFQTASGARGTVAGIACLKAGDWQIVALADAAPRDPGGFATAGGDMPTIVRSALDTMISGDPLDAEQERAARNRGWAPP
jgi:negative regulator of sigma E activity